MKGHARLFGTGGLALISAGEKHSGKSTGGAMRWTVFFGIILIALGLMMIFWI